MVLLGSLVIDDPVLVVDETTVWDQLAAIGTLAAVVVALGLAVIPVAWRRRRRARLRLAVSGVEPHCVPVPAQHQISIADQVLLRLEVANDGASAADAVWARVNRRWHRDAPIPSDWPPDVPRPYRTTNWTLLYEEPMDLPWSNQPLPGVGTPTRSIAPGQSEFVEVAVLRSREGRLVVKAAHPASALLPLDTGFGDYRWEVLVGASNTDTVQVVIEFSATSEHYITSVSLVDAPEAFDDHRLFRLLRSVEQSDGVQDS